MYANILSVIMTLIALVNAIAGGTDTIAATTMTAIESTKPAAIVENVPETDAPSAISAEYETSIDSIVNPENTAIDDNDDIEFEIEDAEVPLAATPDMSEDDVTETPECAQDIIEDVIDPTVIATASMDEPIVQPDETIETDEDTVAEATDPIAPSSDRIVIENPAGMPCCTTVVIEDGWATITNTHGGYFVQVIVTENDYYAGNFSLRG